MHALYQTGYGQHILAVLDSNDIPLFFKVQRDSMLNYGEVIKARITRKNDVLRGYFAETDKKLAVFIPTQQAFCEGDCVKVQITKEARLGKEATGKVVDMEVSVGVPDIKSDLPSGIHEIVPDVQNVTDFFITEALETSVSFAEGALLHIERTQGCWCIDIDTSKSFLSFEEINKQASVLIYNQILLKNLSGMILIDFAGFKKIAEQKKLTQQMQHLFETDKRTTVYGFTKMRLFELKRTRTTAALADLFLTPSGERHPAALAPIMMRRILQCKKGHIMLKVHPALLAWLPENIYTYCCVQTDLNREIDDYEIKGE